MPDYDEDNWLCKYNYLQSLRIPLAFDQLVGQIDYVKGNKSCVTSNGRRFYWVTAFSNNIMMAGKHYALFEACHGMSLSVGVMRPGEAMQSAHGIPLLSSFYQNFTQRKGSEQYNNTVNCCLYFAGGDGSCLSHDWESEFSEQNWEGMEGLSPPYKIGMLLDLDEGTLSVYNNGRRLGVMKRGLAGHYCWVVSLQTGQVTIKRGTVPPS